MNYDDDQTLLWDRDAQNWPVERVVQARRERQAREILRLPNTGATINNLEEEP